MTRTSPPSKRSMQAWTAFASGRLEEMPAYKPRAKTPKKQPESKVNDVAKEWAGLKGGVLYRNRRGMVRLDNGGMFPYGLGPNGTGDLVGYMPVRITPAMVGKVLPIYTEIECKTDTGRVEPHQAKRIIELTDAGAIAGCVRNAADCESLLYAWLAMASGDER